LKSWCIKCRKEVDVVSPTEIIHNNREAMKGTCKVCKTEIITYNVEGNP